MEIRIIRMFTSFLNRILIIDKREFWEVIIGSLSGSLIGLYSKIFDFLGSYYKKRNSLRLNV